MKSPYLTSDMMHDVLIVFFFLIYKEGSIVLVALTGLTCPTIVISRSSVMKRGVGSGKKYDRKFERVKFISAA